MLSIFRYYNITPLFIFDGKPPTEKKALLIQRRKERNKAIIYYDILNDKLEGPQIKEEDKQEILLEMLTLKKQMVVITRDKIERVKELLRAYGATYFDALGEADELCAMLVIKKKVWACLSEDMDMFVYGCPRVIRYLSLLNHTIVLYDMKEILDKLGFTQKELREICILSGTDYNSINGENSSNLYTSLKYFKQYQNENSDDEFYKWLNKTTDFIKDYELLKKIYKMFELTEDCNIKIFENIKIANSPIMKNELKNILKIDGFIFPL